MSHTDGTDMVTSSPETTEWIRRAVQEIEDLRYRELAKDVVTICKSNCLNTNICKHGYCPPHSYSHNSCNKECRQNGY